MICSNVMPAISSNRKTRIIEALIIFVVLACVLTMLTGCDSSTGSSNSSNTQSSEVQHEKVAAKASVEEYTWEELSAISQDISSAEDEASAIQVAKDYGLCTQSGDLDGTQTKSITMLDGTKNAAQVVGIYHDDKTSGGKAGLTFMLLDVIGKHSMNSEDLNTGGWENSSMRDYLDSEGMNMLPEDLRRQIVGVSKKSNNYGEEAEMRNVTGTSDKLWLFSATEVYGVTDNWSEEYSYSKDYDNLVNAEGTQYSYFSHLGISQRKSDKILKKTFGGDQISWWLRTPDPDDSDIVARHTFQNYKKTSDAFFIVDYMGGLAYTTASTACGVVPGFCL